MSSLNLLDANFIKTIKDDLVLTYKENLKMYREDTDEDYENEHLTAEFQTFFKKAIFSQKLNNFSPINWYWLQLIEKLVYIIGLHEDLEISDDFILSESEDAVFNFWNESDFAKSFLEMINESRDLLKVSTFHLNLLQEQVSSFFVLHIDFVSNTHGHYYNVPEIGDGEARIYSRRLNSFFEASALKDGHIYTISTNDKDLLINEVKAESQATTFLTTKPDIISSSKDMDARLPEFTKRINDALAIIKECSPELYNVFHQFTSTIVPINEKGIVSYSMQILPDFSCINMYERDFVDLIDDLLHENGHHYLNTILNTTDLIFEDDEKIYYSPWREALRPVRGIYHAYLTFFWAFELFNSLSKALSTNVKIKEAFSEAERNKIYTRTLEEYHMLTYCIADLDHAFKEQKITEYGKELVDYVTSNLKSNKNFVEGLKDLMTNDSKEKVELLSRHLHKTREHYNLN